MLFAFLGARVPFQRISIYIYSVKSVNGGLAATDVNSFLKEVVFGINVDLSCKSGSQQLSELV